MNKIVRILMKRDGMTSEEADNLIDEAKETLQNYLDEGDSFEAENVCEEFFGLEPDYLYELIPF